MTVGSWAMNVIGTKFGGLILSKPRRLLNPSSADAVSMCMRPPFSNGHATLSSSTPPGTRSTSSRQTQPQPPHAQARAPRPGLPTSSAAALGLERGLTTLQAGHDHSSGRAKQLTYNTHPLYRYIGVHTSGDLTGQGLKQHGASWYLTAPNGKKIDDSSALNRIC